MLPFMMGDHQKKMASVIVEKAPEVKNVSENETDYGPGKEAAAKDIIDGIEKKDHKLVLSAIEDLIAMCMDEYETQEGPEEESAEPSPALSIVDHLKNKWK